MGNSLSSGQFVSIGKASELLGVSKQALRLWESEGRISSYRTCGGAGHRRYRLSELQKEVLGVDPSGCAEKKVALYCRCSHVSQRANLKRQRDRLLSEVSERENCDASELVVYQEIASSFGNRPQLNKLIDAVINRKISRIYVEHGDRLSRVASLTRLVEYLCRSHQVEIVALDREQDEDDMKANMAELVEFVHVISCRTIARRTAERRRKKLSPECVEFLKKHIQEGWGLKEIARLLNASGFKTEDGKRISYKVVWRYSQTLKLLPSDKNPRTGKRSNVNAINHSFAQFADECLVKKKSARCQSKAVYEAYCDWCKKKGLNPLVKRKVSEWLITNKFPREIKCGYCWYKAEIKGYPNVLKAHGNNAKKARRQKG